MINVLGPGVAVNVSAFLSELDKLVERGVPRPDVRVSRACAGPASPPYPLRFPGGGAAGQGELRVDQVGDRPVLR